MRDGKLECIGSKGSECECSYYLGRKVVFQKWILVVSGERVGRNSI